MKSIKQVEIINFQAHANTVVEFAPSGNLTVVTGNSDSGKTSIIRALRWAFYNAPQGTDFIRVGCTMVQVKVTMDDGWSVTRLRTPSKNQYIITHPSGDEQTYEGFGNNVPVEVQQMLGVAPVDVGDMDLKLNIAEQLDGPFLGNSIAASFRAKVLGKLAGTEDVDVANKQLGTDLYRHNRDLESAKSQLETKVAQIEELAWVEGLGQKIAQLEVLAQTIKSKQDQLKDLKQLNARHAELSGRINNGKAYLARYQGLDGATEALNTATIKQQQSSGFQALKNRHSTLLASIEDALHTFSRYEYADDAAAYIYDGTPDKLKSLQALTRLQSQHDSVDRSLAKCQEHLDSLKGVPELSSHFDKANSASMQLVNLTRLNTRLVIRKHELNQAKETLEQLGDIGSVSSMVANTTDSLTKLVELRQYTTALDGIRESTEKTLGSLELAKHTLDNATTLYEKTLQEAGICPTCGAVAHEFKLKEVI